MDEKHAPTSIGRNNVLKLVVSKVKKFLVYVVSRSKKAPSESKVKNAPVLVVSSRK